MAAGEITVKCEGLGTDDVVGMLKADGRVEIATEHVLTSVPREEWNAFVMRVVRRNVRRNHVENTADADIKAEMKRLRKERLRKERLRKAGDRVS